MNLNLRGKKAFVTGSSRGVGFEIAKILSEEGCQIVLNGRDKGDLSYAALNLNVAGAVVGDVSDPIKAKHIVHQVINLIDGLDILVCNVGGGKSVKPGEENYEEWQRVFGRNLWSTTNIIEAANPYLIDSKGSIVCISSICGLEVVPNAPITYSAAKAALHAYVKGIARPLGFHGVRINAIALGNILFEGSVWDEKMTRDPDLVKKMLEQEVSLNQFGTTRDAARLTAYLVSHYASFATGSIWKLDGGQIRS